jgi:outer membrane protein OmpA-like peptidoglycan-associated protein
MTMVHRLFSLSALSAAVFVVACSSVPERNAALEDARSRLNTAQADAQVQKHAADELRRASTALQRADAAHAAKQPSAEVDHLAYLSLRRVTLAQETSDTRQAQTIVEGARAERDAMLLTLRTQEADEAQRKLAGAERRVERQGAELAQADRNAAINQAQLAQAGRDAAATQADLARSDARTAALEAELKLINARRTERGIVVTLGDMLFDSGQSRVLAAGASSVGGLAEFMRRNPNRRASIEGYTDSMGSDSANQQLSDRRAGAVRDMLVGLGITADRLTTTGHGEANPVASNDTADGRRSNRRVEIVFAREAGDILTR